MKLTSQDDDFIFSDDDDENLDEFLADIEPDSEIVQEFQSIRDMTC